MKTCLVGTLCTALIAALAGCSSEPQTATPATSDQSLAENKIDASAYLLESEPEGAGNVIKVREESADSDEVLIVGRIGGSSNPWIEGRAALPSLTSPLRLATTPPATIALFRGTTAAKPINFRQPQHL